MQEDLSQVIDESVVGIKNKVLPMTNAETAFSYEGNIIEMKALYDFFGLNFRDRRASQQKEINEKMEAVLDYIHANSDRPIEDAIAEMAQKFGTPPSDISSLDHFHNKIQVSNSATQTAPKQDVVQGFADEITETQQKIEQLKNEIQASKSRIQSAKELQKVQEQMERLERRRDMKAQQLETIIEDSGLIQNNG